MMLNVASRLSATARLMPEAVAVVEPLGYDRQGKRRYRQISFRQLDDQSDRIARGLGRMGVRPGTRLALLVRPGVDFVVLVFALFKAGAVAVLIDPGMGRRNAIRCLAEAEPEGFVAGGLVQAIRLLLRRRFPKARYHVTVGRRWFWDGVTLDKLRREDLSGASQVRTDTQPAWPPGLTRISSAPSAPSAAPAPLAPAATPARLGSPDVGPDDPAAIIFTSGSTGPPKGVLYCHGNFQAQVDEIRQQYDIRPGEIDLAAFPLFALFNCAMGVTAVIPDMDPSHPARVDPRKIIEAIDDWKVTQAFGSPAIWNRVGRYCQEHAIRLPTVRRVLSAGAPVPANVLERMKSCIHPEGDVHTPYGATESLPVATLAASEILAQTWPQTRQGAGVCVGRKFPGIQWKIIAAVDGPIGSLSEAYELPAGQIGELIVHGPVVTRQYVTGKNANLLGKIVEGSEIWHRLGDVGYLDDAGRFWFCGRMAHRVLATRGPMYTIPCEAIFNQHPAVSRSALVGIGPPGSQEPVIVLEPRLGRMPRRPAERQAFLDEIRSLAATSPLTAGIGRFLLHPSFPVDIRHNAKISREKLALWAARQVSPKLEPEP
jgi:acyl-CoA synthetase (AMP-forming)/AMP-acid ligase II